MRNYFISFIAKKLKRTFIESQLLKFSPVIFMHVILKASFILLAALTFN